VSPFGDPFDCPWPIFNVAKSKAKFERDLNAEAHPISAFKINTSFVREKLALFTCADSLFFSSNNLSPATKANLFK
jgi:hypothetical protein